MQIICDGAATERPRRSLSAQLCLCVTVLLLLRLTEGNEDSKEREDKSIIVVDVDPKQVAEARDNGSIICFLPIEVLQ